VQQDLPAHGAGPPRPRCRGWSPKAGANRRTPGHRIARPGWQRVAVWWRGKPESASKEGGGEGTEKAPGRCWSSPVRCGRSGHRSDGGSTDDREMVWTITSPGRSPRPGGRPVAATPAALFSGRRSGDATGHRPPARRQGHRGSRSLGGNLGSHQQSAFASGELCSRRRCPSRPRVVSRSKRSRRKPSQLRFQLLRSPAGFPRDGLKGSGAAVTAALACCAVAAPVTGNHSRPSGGDGGEAGHSQCGHCHQLPQLRPLRNLLLAQPGHAHAHAAHHLLEPIEPAFSARLIRGRWPSASSRRM